jgi:hypothetical protein
MGKRWWRQVSGLSNLQRQASRKLGIPLSRSGRRQKVRNTLGALTPRSGKQAGCGILLLAVVGVAATGLLLLI